jgi:hypothetical protein
MARRVLKWLLFSVVIGAIPAAINGFLALVLSDPLDFSLLWNLSVLFGKGELLMLAVGLSANAVGDAVAKTGVSSTLRMSIIGVSFVMGLVAMAVFGIVKTLQATNEDFSGAAVAIASAIPYIVLI